MNYQELKGNLINLSLSGKFDVITHGCNCFCKQASGIALTISKTFGTNLFPLEVLNQKGNINKLGQIDAKLIKPDILPELKKPLWVINSYTQYNYGKNHADGDDNPLDYEALTLCLRKINKVFKGKKIGLPLIGCGLAGGIWDATKLSTEHSQFLFDSIPGFKDVKTIVKEELRDMDVTIVHFS